MSVSRSIYSYVRITPSLCCTGPSCEAIERIFHWAYILIHLALRNRTRAHTHLAFRWIDFAVNDSRVSRNEKWNCYVYDMFVFGNILIWFFFSLVFLCFFIVLFCVSDLDGSFVWINNSSWDDVMRRGNNKLIYVYKNNDGRRCYSAMFFRLENAFVRK